MPYVSDDLDQAGPCGSHSDSIQVSFELWEGALGGSKTSNALSAEDAEYGPNLQEAEQSRSDRFLRFRLRRMSGNEKEHLWICFTSGRGGHKLEQ